MQAKHGDSNARVRVPTDVDWIGNELWMINQPLKKFEKTSLTNRILRLQQ